MRILIENGVYQLQNMGDIAMLQTAVERLRTMLPEAECAVVTARPDLLEKLIPGATAVFAPIGRYSWVESRNLFGPLHRLMPTDRMRERIGAVESSVRMSAGRAGVKWISHRLRARGRDDGPLQEFISFLDGFDAVMTSGGGYLTAEFEDASRGILATLGAAAALRKKIALMGQGLGPFAQNEFLHNVSAVMGKASLIGLRERLIGPVLLDQMGVPRTRVAVTGDDAVGLAYERRTSQSGPGIGINFRLARYAAVSESLARECLAAIEKFAAHVAAPLVAVPISFNDQESDLESLKRCGFPL